MSFPSPPPFPPPKVRLNPNPRPPHNNSEEEERQRQVHARPLPASTFQPSFVPKPAEHAPVLPDAAPRLATEARAGQWGSIQEQREQRRAALARAAGAIEAEKRRAAEMEERRLRRTAVEDGVG